MNIVEAVSPRRDAMAPSAGASGNARASRAVYGPSPGRVSPGIVTIESSTLRRAAIFRGLGPVDAAVLAGELRVLLRRAVQLVSGAAGDGGCLYIVLDGRVKLSQASSVGRQLLIGILGPGQEFGEISVLEKHIPVTATAIIDGTLAVLDRDRLLQAIANRPAIAKALLGALAGHQWRRATRLYTDVAFLDVSTRLARLLLELADRYGTNINWRIAVPHGLSQLELAQLVGGSRESVNRALASFATQGWKQVEAKCYDILPSIEPVPMTSTSTPRSNPG